MRAVAESLQPRTHLLDLRAVDAHAVGGCVHGPAGHGALADSHTGGCDTRRRWRRLARVAARFGHSQAALAAMLDMTQQNLSQIESGNRTSARRRRTA